MGGERDDGQHEDDGRDEPDGDVVDDVGEPGDAHGHIMDHISTGYRPTVRRARRRQGVPPGWVGSPLRARVGSADVVVLAVEPVEGVLGPVGSLVDLVAVLAAGLLVGEVADLVEPLADLLALAVDQSLAPCP